MKVIAVEEHFAAAKVPGIVLENLPHLAPNTHKGSAWAADPTTLFEIGEKRIANMDRDGISMQIISMPLAQSFPADVWRWITAGRSMIICTKESPSIRTDLWGLPPCPRLSPKRAPMNWNAVSKSSDFSAC